MTVIDFNHYTTTLNEILRRVQVTDRQGRTLSVVEGVNAFVNIVRQVRSTNKKLMWMGNGGSAAIASHEANDFMKNGNCRSQAFHEPSALTCISNDFGFKHYFEQMVSRFADPNDVTVFISSSGKSENVILGAGAALKISCKVITLSGFGADNPLRALGDLNFYAPSGEYGYVELSHQILCHGVLDLMAVADAAST